VNRHRERRAFTGTEQDAAGEQGRQPDRAGHRKLHERPGECQRQNHQARGDAVGDKADQNGGEAEQEKEARSDELELLRRKREVLHDRHGGEAKDRLVREIDQHIDQHVEKQKTGDRPRGFWFRFRSHGSPLFEAVRVLWCRSDAVATSLMVRPNLLPA